MIFLDLEYEYFELSYYNYFQKIFFKTIFGITLFLPHEIMKSGIFAIFRVSSLKLKKNLIFWCNDRWQKF